MMRYVLLLSGDNNRKCNYFGYACDLAYATWVLEERWGTVETGKRISKLSRSS